MNERAITALLLIVMIGFFGYFMFTIGQFHPKEKQYTLKPYSGLGSGVLAPGTVLKENYKDPSSIIGKAEGGVYILEEVRDGN